MNTRFVTNVLQYLDMTMWENPVFIELNNKKRKKKHNANYACSFFLIHKSLTWNRYIKLYATSYTIWCTIYWRKRIIVLPYLNFPIGNYHLLKCGKCIWNSINPNKHSSIRHQNEWIVFGGWVCVYAYYGKWMKDASITWRQDNAYHYYVLGYWIIILINNSSYIIHRIQFKIVIITLRGLCDKLKPIYTSHYSDTNSHRFPHIYRVCYIHCGNTYEHNGSVMDTIWDCAWPIKMNVIIIRCTAFIIWFQLYLGEWCKCFDWITIYTLNIWKASSIAQ